MMRERRLVIASVVLEKDGKYLLVQEKKAQAYGKWNLPGGRLDPGETLEQAAIREAKEETGLEVKIKNPVFVLDNNDDSPLLNSFSAEITGGKLELPEDEILDAKWYTYDEIKALSSELRNRDYVIGTLEKINKQS